MDRLEVAASIGTKSGAIAGQTRSPNPVTTLTPTTVPAASRMRAIASKPNFKR